MHQCQMPLHQATCNIPGTKDYVQIDTSIDPLQQIGSSVRLYHIFDQVMLRVEYWKMTWISKITVLSLLVFTGWNCLDTPNYPDEPYIEFLSVSKDTLRQGIFMEDSLQVRFSFQDGDGDLGRDDQSPENNVFFIDERTGTLDNTFGIPSIPQEGAANGVEGEVRIVLFSTCCIYNDGQDPCTPNPSIPYDTVQYRIYIMDKAGHKSNEILTTPIILTCN